MSTSRLGCTRATSRRVPWTVRGCVPRAGLGVWDFTGNRTLMIGSESACPGCSLSTRGLAVTQVPEIPHWPGSPMDGFLPAVTRKRCFHTLFAVWDEPWFGEPEGS